MQAPDPSWYRFARRAVRSLRVSLPTLMSGHTSRRDNVVLSIMLAGVTIPLFALIYIVLGDPAAAWFCILACAGVIASALICIEPSRLGLARETLTISIFLLLLALSANVGGGRAPSVIWFALCPMIAAAGGGPSRGAAWLGICLLAMLSIYVGDLVGIFPPPVVSDLHVLSFIGNAGFLLLMGLFMLFYELNNTAAIRRLKEAMATIEQMAISDELTGILNRRELLRIAQQEGLRARRYGHPLCFCMIDVDHFKSVNDTYGHRAGDEVLKQLAALIGDMVRSTDYFGRYGGEEFLLIMSGTGEAGALEFAGRLRDAAERLSIATLPGLTVTISIGVAECSAAQSVEQAIDRADLALYRAKAGGRNRVEADGGAAPPARSGLS